MVRFKSFLRKTVRVWLFLNAFIFVHELGHYIACRTFGVSVIKFQLGFGPELVSFGHGETQYKLKLIPFVGGVFPLSDDYLEVIGQEGVKQLVEDRPALASVLENRERFRDTKTPVKRIVILLAGPGITLLAGLGFLLWLRRRVRIDVRAKETWPELRYNNIQALLSLLSSHREVTKRQGSFLYGAVTICLFWFDFSAVNLLPVPPLDGAKFWEEVFRMAGMPFQEELWRVLYMGTPIFFVFIFLYYHRVRQILCKSLLKKLYGKQP